MRALYDAPYENENAFGRTYGEHREALELDMGAFVEVEEHAGERGLAFIATAFDPDAVDFCMQVGVDALKIASGDATNTPLIEYAGQFSPLIVSLGGVTQYHVDMLHEFMLDNTKYDYAFLQCTASYPVQAGDLRLPVVARMLERYPNTIIGLSDHYSGIFPGVLAYGMGARIMEKHFTLNRAAKGTDHAFSMEPHGMAEYVSHLKAAYEAMQSDVKEPLECEKKPLYKMGKKLVAKRALSSGTTLKDSDIAIKSPNDGLPPYELDGVIGKYLTEPLEEDQNIEEGWE
jgi:N-acetylneuraminate synthase/sialic acid synthase